MEKEHIWIELHSRTVQPCMQFVLLRSKVKVKCYQT